MDSPKLSLDDIGNSPRSHGERKIGIGLELLANPKKQVSSQESEHINKEQFNIDEDDDIKIDKLSFNLEGDNGDDNLGNLLDDLNKLDLEDEDNRSHRKDTYSFDRNSNRDDRRSYDRDKKSYEERRSDKRSYDRRSYDREDRRSYEEKKSNHSYRSNREDNRSYGDDKRSQRDERRSIRDEISHRSEPRAPTFEEIRKEKEDLLMKFEKLKRLGNIKDVKFNMASDLDEMRFEYNRIMKEKKTESSVKFSRKMLLAFVTGVEFLNNRFDPFDVKLDGWSESVHENIHDYDEIFEELSEKYKAKSKMSPELKLLLTLGGSGFMFHLTNTMFKSSLPGMDDVLKQNPDLMNQFANAAINQMNGGMGGSGGNSGMGGAGGNSGMGGPSTPPFMPFNQGTERKEMNTPKDVDDILNELKENTSGEDNISIIDDSLSRSGNKKRRGKKSSGNSISLDL